MGASPQRLLGYLLLAVGVVIWILLVWGDEYSLQVIWIPIGIKVSTNVSTSKPSFRRHPSVADMDCAPFFNSSRSVTTRLTLNTSLIPKTDCESIRARHHFASMPYSEEEAEYPIAIARVVFRDYYLLEQMLAVQFAPQNSYCYAMDAKSSPEFKKAMRDLAGCFENVHVLEQEFALDSMGHFMNIAHWECAKALHKNPWEYFFMMQNHDIPIKTNLETVRIVKMLNGLNDIESGPFPGGGRVHKNSSFAFEDLELFKDDRLNQNGSLLLSKGGVQGAFTRAAIDYLLEKLNMENLLDELNLGSSYVDETFAATINTDPTIALPGGRAKTCNGKEEKLGQLVKFTIWYDASLCGSGVMRHSVCVFGVEDLPKFLTAPQIYANKMLPEMDYLALSCLLERVQQRAFLGETNLQPDEYKKFVEKTTCAHSRKSSSLNLTSTGVPLRV